MLSNRPLYASEADRRLFVETDAARTLFDAVRRGRNVLIEGGWGSGKTSVMHILELELRERAQPVLYVSLEQADDLEHATLALYRPAAAAGWASDGEDLLDGDDPFAANQLIRALDNAPRDAVFLIDGIDGDVGHRLFGRLRDELWQLERIWVVAAETSQVARLLRPPADAFFEVRIRLEEFTVDSGLELLERRGTKLDEADVMLLTINAHTPRQLIEAARRVVDDGESPEQLAGGIARRRELAERSGGRAGAMLVPELESMGPVSAGDKELLSRMGWTRPRAVGVLRQLEEAGIVESHRESSSGPGQPRKLYVLRDPVLFAEENE